MSAVMELSSKPDLPSLCSLSADVISVINFIMEVSMQKPLRDYILSQEGPIVKDLLNMLHRVGGQITVLGSH
jgi:hypothetical protein